MGNQKIQLPEILKVSDLNLLCRLIATTDPYYNAEAPTTENLHAGGSFHIDNLGLHRITSGHCSEF